MLDAADRAGQALDPRLHKKLAECLLQRGDVRAGTYFLRQYRTQLLLLRAGES